jgi:predicted nucleotidyltransferase
MEYEDWTVVKTKNNKKNYSVYNPTFDEIKNNIVSTLKKYNPYAIYIYGSRAKKTNNINSDVDILVIWLNEPFNLEFIKNEIITNLKLKIDFVNLIYKKNLKKSKITDVRDECYYENIITEAINIYKNTSENIYLSDIIPFSIKLPKI